MPDIGNEFWTPSCNLVWRPKREIFERKTCDCQIHSHFDIFGDDEQCNKCGGRGYVEVRIPDSLTKPEWPNDYIAYMKRCHDLYIKRTRKFRG